MKKIIAIVLAVLMMCAACVSIAAAGGETLTAPTFQGIQTRVNAADSAKIDVRFISTVNSLYGDKLGYKVVATFANASGKSQTITYTGEKTEAAVVYSSIMVDGVSKAATEFDADAKGVYVFTITGIPNEYLVEFAVTTYVTLGSEKVEATTTYKRNVDAGDATAVTYSENFDNAATAADAGVSNIYLTSNSLNVVDGKLSVHDQGWVNDEGGGYHWSLVSGDDLTGAGKYGKYVLDMDVTINDKIGGCFALYLNNTPAVADGKIGAANNRPNDMVVSFRRANDGELTHTNGAIADGDDLLLQFISFNADGGGQTTVKAVKAADITGDSISFKLSVVVDSNAYTGCSVSVYVDGVCVGSWAFEEAKDVAAGDGIVLWAQNTPATIDNLVIRGIAEENVKPTIPTNFEEIYSENFDNAATAADAGVSNIYLTSNSLNGVEGKLSVHDQGWVNAEGGGYHWSLVDGDALTGAGKYGKYLVEMDLELVDKVGSFAFYLNNTPAVADGKIGDNNNRPNDMVVSLRRSSTDDGFNTSNGAIESGKDLLCQFIDFNSTSGSQTTRSIWKAADMPDDGSTTMSFKLSILVDSSYANGCQVSVFMDGEFVGSWLFDETKDVVAGDGIVLWAQNSPATIDNLVIKGIK